MIALTLARRQPPRPFYLRLLVDAREDICPSASDNQRTSSSSTARWIKNLASCTVLLYEDADGDTLETVSYMQFLIADTVPLNRAKDERTDRQTATAAVRIMSNHPIHCWQPQALALQVSASEQMHDKLAWKFVGLLHMQDDGT